jgi:hypothetical protein
MLIDSLNNISYRFFKYGQYIEKCKRSEDWESKQIDMLYSVMFQMLELEKKIEEAIKMLEWKTNRDAEKN